MENLKSEFIGWVQSKITGAYFAKHPEIQINSQLYIARKILRSVLIVSFLNPHC